MAFLDNTGDIILDAVLTDTGRKRLAQGDGSFRIVKFALADDEIDYSLYRNNNSAAGRHPSGSAYYDLNILQTPVLEAFTNNTSLMKSKLVTYSRNDLLYLPVVKLNDGSGPEQWPECSTTSIAVDKNGENGCLIHGLTKMRYEGEPSCNGAEKGTSNLGEDVSGQ